MLSRKEFKELLNEWQNNFINERGQYASNFKKDIPCFLIGIKRKDILSLIEYLYDNNVSNVKENIDNYSSKVVGGIAIEKSEDVIEEIFNHSASVIDSSLMSRKEEIKISRTPLIIFPAYGNARGEKDKKDEYAWITHDLEHALFGFGTPMVFNKKLENKLKSDYPDEESWIRLISGTNSNYTRGPGDTNPSRKIEKPFEKFFNDPQISFTKGVGHTDIYGSIWAYCIARMESKFDLSSVDNSSLDEQEKKVVKGVLLQSYDNVMSGLEVILRNIDNQIIIIKRFS